MARRQISEYRAKAILYRALGLSYSGIPIDTDGQWQQQLPASADTRYVVKVDEGVKGRFKKGLVLLDRPAHTLAAGVKQLLRQGFRYLLIEEYLPHDSNNEHYLAIERQRVGNIALFSSRGGIHIEDHRASLQQAELRPTSGPRIERQLDLPAGTLDRLHQAFDDHHFAFLELNPLVVTHGTLHLLDAAVEVDDAAATLVKGHWTPADFRVPRAKTPEELAVEELASRSQASFKLEVLNPDGAIFLLLSGGGASVVLADEVHNQGYGRQLGNYGEYSGNPNQAETYTYTKQVISLLLRSAARSKVLVIGGGVANFTDIRQTFQGVIGALSERADELRQQDVKVYVRRGGPYETEGLALMQAFLEQAGLLGLVAGPDMAISDIIPAATRALSGATS